MEKPDREDKKYWRSQSNSWKDDKWFFKENLFNKDMNEYLKRRLCVGDS